MATKPAPAPSAGAPADISDPAVPRLMTGLVERPRLFALLERGALGPVTLITAPAGSGKTMLLSSWLRSALLPGAVAWVGVERDETDATRFWGMVMDALRRSGAIGPDDPATTLVPAPAGGQEEFLRRLVEGLERASRTVLLVLDDLHHLRSEDGLHSLEQLLARAPAQLRIFMVSRRDPKLGLHRLRLAGELVEIRAADLDFTAEEAGELMAAAGVSVENADVDRLHARTEDVREASLDTRDHPGDAVADQVAAQEDALARAADGFIGMHSTSDGLEADLYQAELEIALDDLDSQADDFRAQGADVQEAFWSGYEDGRNGA